MICGVLSDATPNKPTEEQLSAELETVLIAGESIIKSGRKTTEFWIVAALVAGLLIGVGAGKVSGDEGATLASVSSILYMVLRTGLKAQAEANAAALDKGGDK